MHSPCESDVDQTMPELVHAALHLLLSGSLPAKIECFALDEPLSERICNILLGHDHGSVRPHAADDQHAVQLVQLVLKVWRPFPTPQRKGRSGLCALQEDFMPGRLWAQVWGKGWGEGGQSNQVDVL